MALHYNKRRSGNGFVRAKGWANDIWSLGGLLTGNLGDYIPELEHTYGIDLTDAQWEQIMEAYYNEGARLLGNTVGTVDYKPIGDDIAKMLAALQERPDEPLQYDFLDDARSQIAAENASMYADLDKLMASRTASYEDELANLASNYRTARTGLLSQQQMQNAQLMDSLQSGMERSRRNALEAGASAGIRIADNINTLLSVQNKQSATSMETANQLSQMMINQRNAESEARRSYEDYKTQDVANRHSIQLSSENRAGSLADTNYNAAYNKYNKEHTDWSNQYMNNPMFEYMKSKPKYSNEGT